MLHTEGRTGPFWSKNIPDGAAPAREFTTLVAITRASLLSAVKIIFVPPLNNDKGLWELANLAGEGTSAILVTAIDSPVSMDSSTMAFPAIYLMKFSLEL